MNNRNKTIATGTSILGLLGLIFHFWHIAHTAETFTKKNEYDILKNAPVYFIQQDSTGKKDTMLMKDYLKRKELNDPGRR